MRTEKNYGKAIVSVDILDINAVEMRQMCELEKRIADVLYSHIVKTDENGNAIKKQYLSDDELRMIRAILLTLTKGYESSTSSMFDKTLEELKDWENSIHEDAKPEESSYSI